MEIKTAEFVVSNTTYKKCPTTGLPEYAFIGRSNVGKSSLINMLTRNKGLAKTSVRPGKTQLINHFLINKSWYIVDLPGYGYARISKSERAAWQKMIEEYFLNREALVNTFVLLDSRIPPQRIDLDFISFLGHNGVPLSLVYTKVDKQKQSEVMRNINAMKAELAKEWDELPLIMMTSSVSGYGRDNLLDFIDSINHSLTDNNDE
ncbi:MAG: ribosome biogenesis GTP-binding protein YihA/YsxC [Bacteroidales bacterium]|nr:ribosome biogenesis GTP-binding protein YihA/YsxC [Bacteroidales bacterium]